MPPPASAIAAMPARSCGPQSHLRLPRTSPVRQAECSRVRTGGRVACRTDQQREMLGAALGRTKGDDLGVGRARRAAAAPG